MTLQQHLNQYIEKHCLSGADAAKRIGINGQQVSTVRLHNRYSQLTAKKICDLLGLDFTDYFDYSVCPYCGIQYVKATSIQATCTNAECRKTHKVATVKAYDADIRSGKRKVEKHYNERKPLTKKYIVIEDTKHKQSIPEFMDGKQYGERQLEYLLGIQKGQRMEIR